MNDIVKTIFERRAIRKYKEKAVSKENIEQIIDAGRMAPSAMNRQPWKFYVVTSKEDIKLFSREIAKEGLKIIPKMGIKGAVKSIVTGITNLSHGIDFLLSKDPVFHEAPVVIFITAPKDNEWAALDIGMCAQNMMLSAKSLGLDSCPVGFGKFVEKTKNYSKLNIPIDDQVHLAIIIGYGDENPKVHKRDKDNVFYI
jgi:nitroreductase